ncbi:hypothetical protein BV22DRAFT_984200, partial [Leucogyrophana mollusca]
QLEGGADGSQGDDTRHLKIAVTDWLEEETQLLIKSTLKGDHGFYNDTIRVLLCPVDYDWSDPVTREHVRGFHPDCLVTASSWPTFLYEGKFDANNPSKGLFKGKLLKQAFKYIFTSPSSVSEGATSDDDEPPQKMRKTTGERRTRMCVTTLLNMHSVQLRVIASPSRCNELRFALCSCGSWRFIDGDFNHAKF